MYKYFNKNIFNEKRKNLKHLQKGKYVLFSNIKNVSKFKLLITLSLLLFITLISFSLLLFKDNNKKLLILIKKNV